MMKKIRNDLWETQTYSPFPGLTTHAYLWTPPSGQNVLFYSPGTDDDFDEIEDLGGIAHQYLSHQDEASPVLAHIAQRFGARLHTPAPEVDAIRRFAEPHVQFEHRHIDEHGIEVIPTPGHTPGSTCFLVPGADASTYLFTGDTVFLADNGVWTAGFIPDVSDADALESSLKLLSTLTPDLVISSAFSGDAGAHPLGDTPWGPCAEQAITTIPTSQARRA
jgi:hydroxyacylglutathione hydrolase